jgi:hypothetical protein
MRQGAKMSRGMKIGLGILAVLAVIVSLVVTQGQKTIIDSFKLSMPVMPAGSATVEWTSTTMDAWLQQGSPLDNGDHRLPIRGTAFMLPGSSVTAWDASGAVRVAFVNSSPIGRSDWVAEIVATPGVSSVLVNVEYEFMSITLTRTISIPAARPVSRASILQPAPYSNAADQIIGLSDVTVDISPPAAARAGRFVSLTLPEGAEWPGDWEPTVGGSACNLTIDKITRIGTRTIRIPVKSASGINSLSKLVVQNLKVKITSAFRGSLNVTVGGTVCVAGTTTAAVVLPPGQKLPTVTTSAFSRKITIDGQPVSNGTVAGTGSLLYVEPGPAIVFIVVGRGQNAGQTSSGSVQNPLAGTSLAGNQLANQLIGGTSSVTGGSGQDGRLDQTYHLQRTSVQGDGLTSRLTIDVADPTIETVELVILMQPRLSIDFPETIEGDTWKAFADSALPESVVSYSLRRR